jgi:hypothetical protein
MLLVLRHYYCIVVYTRLDLEDLCPRKRVSQVCTCNSEAPSIRVRFSAGCPSIKCDSDAYLKATIQLPTRHAALPTAPSCFCAVWDCFPWSFLQILQARGNDKSQTKNALIYSARKAMKQDCYRMLLGAHQLHHLVRVQLGSSSRDLGLQALKLVVA